MYRMLIGALMLALCTPMRTIAYIGSNGPQSFESIASFPLSNGFTAVKSYRFKIRTITAGINLKSTSDLQTVEAAISFLQRAKTKFQNQGYEIQTLRIATQPLGQYLNGKSRKSALADLKKIDQIVSDKNLVLSIGPVITDDRRDPEFASWAVELVKETKSISFTVTVASPEAGVHSQAAVSAAEAIVAIAKATPGGEGNFRFAAAANCPAGTPFFPVAYHQGQESFSIGLETPALLQEAFQQSKTLNEARVKLKASLESEFQPVEKLALEVASSEHRNYLGIDVSPAPSKEASIGSAIEALTHSPFGSASTLMACATITDVLHSLNIKRCGYSGLMLPVLEDPVLAQRAAEGRYSVRELLLYSSVCGTGLDVVPLAGDTSTNTLTALIADVAALSTKLHKPLSARLFLIPQKKAGERAEFNNPFLTDSVIMRVD
jgi:uncharacterized protein